MAVGDAPDGPPSRHDTQTPENELWWTLERYAILMRCWTMPHDAPPVQSLTEAEKVGRHLSDRRAHLRHPS